MTRSLLTNAVTYAQLAAGMALFGSATPISKIVTEAFPVFLASGIRAATAALALSVVMAVERLEIARLDRREWGLLTLIAAIGMVGFSVAMLYGMKLVSGVAGSIVMSTTPAVTAIASYLFLKDRLGWRKALAIALAVLGVLILNLAGEGEGGRTALLGIALVFAAVVAEACYTLLGKQAGKTLSAATVAGLSGVLGALMFAPPAIWQASSFDFAAPSWGEWGAVLWWGVGTMGLGSLLWYRGVSKVSGSVAAGFMGVMPVSALVLSYALLGEPFHWAQLAGFAVVFAGVLLIAWTHAQSAASGEAEEND
jgi:drug/metabolite transporter (DMT)-like permease